MKKLLSFLAAGALAFGLIGCSGDLHDVPMPKHEPVVIDGASWYYADITVWGDSDGTKEGLIVNNKGNGLQTGNSKLPIFKASDGGVFYYTYDGTGADKGYLNDSYQNDNPAFTPEAGKIRVYVYTPVQNPCLHSWGGPFKATSWPGTPMTKVGGVEAVEMKMTIKKVIVKNLPDSLSGQKLYYRGGLVDSSWGCKEEFSGTVANGEITINIGKDDTKQTATGFAMSSEFKIADASWGTSIGKGFTSDNDAANVSVLISNGATVNIIGVYQEANQARKDKHSCVWTVEPSEE